MRSRQLIFSETNEAIVITGSADIIIFKTSGDILAGRPFPIHGGIVRSAIDGIERDGEQIVLHWKQSGAKRETILGSFEPGHEAWLEKIKLLYGRSQTYVLLPTKEDNNV